MEVWFVIIVATCIAYLLFVIYEKQLKAKSKCYPPGPKGGIPIISSIIWQRKSSLEVEEALRSLRPKFGPIITISVTSSPLIFISSHALAHEALIQKGSIFADRPKPLPVLKFLSNNQHNISTASYGPLWRLLRRNLTVEILHPSRVKDYSNARQWVLKNLVTRLREANCGVKVKDHFQFAMFSLLVLMCFGDKLDETQIKEVENVHHMLLLSLIRFQILDLWPPVTRVLLRKQWDELTTLRKKQMEVVMRIIRTRKMGDQGLGKTSYVDTLRKLEIEEDGKKRRLNEAEIFGGCSEFIIGGTDTTSAALEWIMANLVKQPVIQSKLYEEIKGVLLGGGAKFEEGFREDQLSKMHYLKAVVLEGLRRHPPSKLLLPHAVTQEVEIGGYRIPENAVINFTVSDIGCDPMVWEDPMEFKPERFLSNGEIQVFDFSGRHEIKMIPFGAGRRICPAIGLAMLHLEYFVGNLVWNFEWLPAYGKEVDLTETEEFSTVMKHPLHVRISPRTTTTSVPK